MFNNFIFLIIVGVAYGYFITVTSRFLAYYFLDKTEKYIRKSNSVFSKILFPFIWVLSFLMIWILFIYISTFLPINDKMWKVFSSSLLVSIFLTIVFSPKQR